MKYLDFNTQAQLIIVHSLEIHCKLLSFVILYFCTFLKLFLKQLGKRVYEVLRPI